MFCTECGSEVHEDALFCTNCGHPLECREESTNQSDTTIGEKAQEPVLLQNIDAQKSGKKINRQKNCPIVISLLVLSGVLLLLFFTKQSNQDKAEGIKGKTEPMVEGITKEPVKEDPYQLLVCVPVENISLRKTPGFGEDVISVLLPGTYLKWYEEVQVVNGVEYYKVTVRDSGSEGYLSARYCVKVDYEGEEKTLDLVETDTAMYTYDMMAEDLDTLQQRYSDFFRLGVIGISADGRKIYKAILGNPKAQNHIMIQSSIHGREYMNSQLVMKMLEYYCCHYDEGKLEGQSYREIFDQTALHIVPMANPDGVVISQQGVSALNHPELADIVYESYLRDKAGLAYEEDLNGDWKWNDYYSQHGYHQESASRTREITFEEYQRIWKSNARGVDLNNNFDADWANIRLKSFPSYSSYKGSQALSERESRALVQMALERDYVCFLSYHSRGQLIYYDVKGNSKSNSQASLNLANTLDQWLKYWPVNTNGAYNVNLGGFSDWVQLSLNKPSVTIESGKSPCPLVLEEFTSIWYRHKESWAGLAKQINDEYRQNTIAADQ